MRAEPDGKPVAVGGFTRLAHGHHHTAPVGVFTGNRRFDERRVGDRQPDGARSSSAFRALNGDGDQLAGPLTVAGNLLGELIADAEDSGFDRLQVGVRADGSAAAQPEGEDGVAGRGIAVDGHGVEGLVGGAAQNTFQPAGFDRCIDENITEHGRHIRGDHARPLGNADHGHGPVTGTGGFGLRPLGEGISGGDGGGGGLQRGFCGVLGQPDRGSTDGFCFQRLADHPG